MKTYTKPIAEIKEFGLSGAIADLKSYLNTDNNAAKLGLSGLTTEANAISSYSITSFFN